MRLLFANLPASLDGQRESLARCLEAMNSVMPLRAVYLFGSHARGEARPDSDVDLCIVANGATEQLKAAGAFWRERGSTHSWFIFLAPRHRFVHRCHRAAQNESESRGVRLRKLVFWLACRSRRQHPGAILPRPRTVTAFAKKSFLKLPQAQPWPQPADAPVLLDELPQLFKCCAILPAINEGETFLLA